MRNWDLDTIIPFTTIVLALLVIGGVSIGTYNDLVRQEKGITAVWRDSQVQYDAFWKKVKETAQVPEAYKDAFKDVMLSTTAARYAEKDPAFLMLAEANPQLDPAMYVQLQRIIEAGRNDFAQTQRTLVDRQRAFDSQLSTFPANLIVPLFGFPHEVQGEYAPQEDTDGDGLKTVLDYRTVTSGRTHDVFSTGREDEPLDVFSEKK